MALTSSLARRLQKRRGRRSGIKEGDRSNDGRGRTALVTGASSGIGKAFAELLAAKGFDVIVVARRKERLEQLQSDLEDRYGIRVHPVTCDLGHPDSVQLLWDELVQRELTVDFLVNNAGYVLSGSYLDNPWHLQHQMLHVMALSTADLSYRVLPHMVDQRWGRIVTVSSVGATFSGSPGQTLYAPIKSFVHKLSESLAAEYEEHGINSTVCTPAATDTELLDDIREYADNSLTFQLTMKSAEDVARETYNGCMQRHRIVTNGVTNKIWQLLLLHSPQRVRYAMVRFVAAMDPGQNARSTKIQAIDDHARNPPVLSSEGEVLRATSANTASAQLSTAPRERQSD